MSKVAMSKTEDTTTEEKEAPEGPILDLSDAAVKKMIKAAKTRGFVTHEELNKVLPSDEFDSEAIENVMSQLNEMGINVVDNEEEGEAAEEEGGAKAIATREETAKPVVTNTREDADRTDDPVRMYLREMGSVELLSREGEIAIAKRIEAGRDAMIRGLCESPLTFEAIMVWRDELREQKILLRDIIDLEATYGAEMGITPPSAPGVNADGLVDPEAAKIEIAETERKKAEAAAARAAPKPPGAEGGEERDPGEIAAEADNDADFDDEAGDLDVGDGSRTQGRRDVDARQHRRSLRSIPQAAGKAHRPALEGQGPPRRAGGKLRDRAEHDHRRAEEAEAQQCADREPGRAALRHQPQAHSA